MSLEAVRSSRSRSMDPGVLQQVIELWEDSPGGFEMLVGFLSRKERPVYGQLIVWFEKGLISQVNKNESHKPPAVTRRQ